MSLATGLRLLVYHRTYDGDYRTSGKGKKKLKAAVSRIMIVSLKMRHVRIRGSGDHNADARDEDELRIANVHLHCRTAKRDVLGGGKAAKKWWDILARYLAEFSPTYLCGDFNMALFCVVPELRARGFQINLAAWYCWEQMFAGQKDFEAGTKADSCGIFRIGPCNGVRMCFDASVFGMQSPTLPATCSMVMEIICDEHGKEIEKRRYPVPQFTFGQGYLLGSYHPKEEKRRAQWLEWSFTPVFDAESPAVAGVIHKAKYDRAQFPFEPDSSIGSASWSLPRGPVSKQKLPKYNLFDPQSHYFRSGAHMPLMIYVGGSNETRRSKVATARRATRAAERGWTAARIQAARRALEGGEHGTQTEGHTQPSAVKGTSGKGGGAGRSGKGWRQSNAWYTSWSSGNAWQ